MKTRYFFFLATAAALLAGCNKDLVEEQIEQTPEGVKTYLTVSVAPETKTVMGENQAGTHEVYWSPKDQIAVNGTASNPLADDFAAGQKSTTFAFDGVLSTPYNIIYPAGIYTDATHVTLPAAQTYKAGGFADGMFPMAGYSADGSNVTLSHLCAIVKISVKRASADADEDNIVAVRFKGRNSEKVNGEFDITYTPTAALTAATGTGSELEVRVNKSLATSTSDAVVYYLVVPARTYSNGFDIIVQDANGHFMTKSKTASWTATAGHLYAMPEFEFVPTGTELGVEITNAQDLIDFATAYNNKEYAHLGSSLIATLKNDISFTVEESAAFNATKGIGLKTSYYGDAEDYYFDGVFQSEDGHNYTISGLSATVPLFKATSSSAVIKNFSIDNSCSFAFTHSKVAELDAGSVVGYHRGTVKNVNVAANISLAAVESVNKVTALGGLVGREVVGTVDNCTYSGNLSVPDGFVVSTQKTYIGGLVGSMTNPDGKVQNSDFEGTIDFAGTVASTDKNDPYLMLGGIVGAVNAGTVSDCEAKGTNTKDITMDNGTAYTATIQNHSRKAYHLAQGGIAGYNAGTVSGCTNGASVKNFVLTKGTADGTASDSNSRYYDVGGIVGLNAEGATVTGCINNGLFESRSTPRIQKIGGIVGYNKGTVSSSSNSATGDIVIASATGQTPYNLRVGEIGGAIGNNEGTVSNIQNAGDITLSRTENGANVEMKFGGVIGITTAAIDGGVGKNISNSGSITISFNPVTVTTDGLRFGGIVGSAQASVQNVSNTGNVTYTLSAANIMSKLSMGGIAGEVRNTANVTVSGCENSGEVYFNVNAKAAAHTGDYIGGIIGFVTGEDVTATVSDCENSGYVHINCNITTACSDLIAAGVVAKFDESGSISDCNNNNGEVDIAFSNAAHTDNYAGGVLGKNGDFAVSLSGCENSGYIHGGNSSAQNGATMFTGGIVAYLTGASSITDCDNSGIVYNNTRNNTDTNVGSTYNGGIAGYVIGNSVTPIAIEDCDNTASGMFSRRGWLGGIVGYAEYADLTNCTFNKDVTLSSLCRGIGGIVGWGANTNVTNCTFSGSELSSTQIQANRAGGILGRLDGGTVYGCSSHVETFMSHPSSNDVPVDGGAIVGISGSGNTIQNCHYKPTINSVAANIVGTGSFTDGGGNVADL